MTDFDALEVLSDGHLRFLALSWPEDGRTAPVPEALAIPVLKRRNEGGGILLCIPCGFLSLVALDAGNTAEPLALLGPSFQVTLPLGVSDEQGLEQPIDVETPVLMVDFGAGILASLREVGEDIVSDAIFPFSLHQPEATPLSDELLAAARSWVSESPLDRTVFYSAQEDASQGLPPAQQDRPPKGRKPSPKKRVTTADLAAQLAQLSSMLPLLTEQLTSVKDRQEALERQVREVPTTGVQQAAKPPHQQTFLPAQGPGLPMAKYASLLGPPPRTRQEGNPVHPLPPAVGGVGLASLGEVAGQDSFQTAMLQQSQALSSLVTHLLSQQEGGVEGLASSASSSYVGSKGAAKREKLQAALAARTGEFFLAVLQSASRRLRPSVPIPPSIEACSGQVSMCQYLERFGGFAGQRENGYLMWCLAHVMDCMVQRDYAGAEEHLALTFAALDQATLDGNRWDFAWLITLLEEPPAQLFHGRGSSVNPRSRAYSPLCPGAWTTCALQYLREIDLIATRRLEAIGRSKPSAPKEADVGAEDRDEQRSKKPPKLPRKPKQDGAKSDRPAPPSGGIFPLPLPFAGVFARFPLGCSSRLRRRIMHRRLLHIVCMALNFLHSNFVPIPPAALQRPCNAAQRSLVARLGRLLKAFGASVGEFVLSDSGRRNPQLIARLSELTTFLATSAVATGDAYAAQSGTAVPMHNDAFQGLDPFRSLDVSRLQLSGRGLWNPLPYLPPELYMAFAEPASLLHFNPPPDDFMPVWTRENPQEVAALASLWDKLGLLRLAPARLSMSESFLLARAFNCYKGPDRDRMIIDRRGRNYAECRLAGPSMFIPVGPMLGMLEVDPGRQSVYCAAADRRDFYHQLKAPDRKSVTNVLGPALPRRAVEHLQAFGRLLPCGLSATNPSALQSPRSLLFEPDHYLVCFAAVAQGDHLGVEVGTAAHSALLESGGLLADERRLCSNRPFKGTTCAEGLVIDDYFSVCVKDLRDPAPPECLRHLSRAKSIYAHESLEGSDSKDIVGACFAKIAGAEINSSEHARRLGTVTVASPAAKRVALAAVSVEAARFGLVTDALWLSLVGSWTSCALFRRPLMAIFSAVYGVASTGSSKPSRPTLCVLPRQAAQELVLASVLCPLASVDLTSLFDPCIYATDASEAKGGYVTAHVGTDLVRPLWRTASKRGGYSRLLSKEEAILVRLDDREPIDLRMLAPATCPSPSRPLAYHFDFVEVGVRGGSVSELLRSMGRSVGPVLDFRVSVAYDIMNSRTFEWILHLLQHRKLKSLLLSPPAAAFSPRKSRCSPNPGFSRPSSAREVRATRVLRRHLALLSSAVQCGVPSVIVRPDSPGFVTGPEWHLLLRFGARFVGTCACAFQGLCCKGWKFLVFGLDLTPLSVPCCRGGLCVQSGPRQHPDDAFLPPLLVKALACEFDRALRRVSHVRSLQALKPEGLENPVLNDVVLSVRWLSGDDWCWRATAHINILETAAIHRLIKALAVRGLTPILRKIAALCLLSGLLPAFHYVHLLPFGPPWAGVHTTSTVVLAEGRPVEPVTQKRRDKLLAAFTEWLLRQNVVFESLFDLAPQSTRRLNGFLISYGRQLFEAGWPYSHYSEVINAVASKEPAIRRSLQPAWDLAFSWLREEPHSHHVALPWQVLLAAITTSLMWGWVRVAGCLALTWGAVMRAGETLAARRCDLLLPGDVWGTMQCCMVSIREPKTRFKAARHQAAKLDQPDLLDVVTLAFADLEPGSKLWPFSASTLRSRFDQLMQRLGTDRWADQGSKRLDLGSLRAGGATWLLQASEDSELVRRRGRWLNARTMEIYVQEISSLQFVHRLSEQARLKVFASVDNFKLVLLVAERLQKARTPTRFWFSHFAGG
ncbi:unnamed protein product [Symbiodinium natans]|uniref:Uncharacterized protein n=1 Tax=Symbiodinium natans TaxID=878477 RepID=A0A812SA15_9DINO|nr:unnamed protein product [Symbiodinium natans]